MFQHLSGLKAALPTALKTKCKPLAMIYKDRHELDLSSRTRSFLFLSLWVFQPPCFSCCSMNPPSSHVGALHLLVLRAKSPHSKLPRASSSPVCRLHSAVSITFLLDHLIQALINVLAASPQRSVPSSAFSAFMWFITAWHYLFLNCLISVLQENRSAKGAEILLGHHHLLSPQHSA